MDINSIEQPSIQTRAFLRYCVKPGQSVGFGGGRRTGAISNSFTPFGASSQFSPPAHSIRSLYLPANEAAILHDLKQKRAIQEPLAVNEAKKRLVVHTPTNLLLRKTESAKQST
jgi:hypothetical protein